VDNRASVIRRLRHPQVVSLACRSKGVIPMTEAYGFTFNVSEWRGTAVNIGELRLTKDQHTAVCSFFNHPTRRVELRCLVDDEIRESRADHDGLALLDLANEWKRSFQEKGWK
jgi:hypothetical protein